MVQENIKAILVVSVGILVIIGISIPIVGIIRELGIDDKFGNIPPTPLNSADGAVKSTKYEVNISEKMNFDRFAKVALTKQTGLTLEKAQGIAKDLGFKENPKRVRDFHQGGTNFVWQNQDKILIFNDLSKGVSFNNSQINQTAGVGTSLEADEAAKKASTLLKKIKLKGDLEVVQTTPIVIRGVLIESTEGFSDGVEVVFSKTYEGYRIIGTKVEGYASVVIGNDGQVKRFTYRPPSVILDEGAYPTKGVNEAIKAVEKGDAVLSEVEIGGISSLLSGTSLDAVVVNEVKLVYIDHPESKYWQPHYQFRGTATVSENEDAKVTLLVNAIKEKYLE